MGFKPKWSISFVSCVLTPTALYTCCMTFAQSAPAHLVISRQRYILTNIVVCRCCHPHLVWLMHRRPALYDIPPLALVPAPAVAAAAAAAAAAANFQFSFLVLMVILAIILQQTNLTAWFFRSVSTSLNLSQLMNASRECSESRSELVEARMKARQVRAQRAAIPLMS